MLPRLDELPKQDVMSLLKIIVHFCMTALSSLDSSVIYTKSHSCIFIAYYLNQQYLAPNR